MRRLTCGRTDAHPKGECPDYGGTPPRPEPRVPPDPGDELINGVRFSQAAAIARRATPGQRAAARSGGPIG